MIETPAVPEPRFGANGLPSAESVVDLDGPPLPPAPEFNAAAQNAHRTFMALNPRSSIPLLRAGLGPWLGTPIGGWMLLLRVRGRKSGQVRDIPLSYLIAEGSAWVMAGFGPRTQWYQNLLVDPNVEVILPGRTRACIASEVRNRAVRARIIPQLVRATGVPGYMTGVDPYHAAPAEMIEATAWVPLIRLRPVGEPLVAGPDDPSGTAWIWRQAVVAIASVWAIRTLSRLGGSTVRLVLGAGGRQRPI